MSFFGLGARRGSLLGALVRPLLITDADALYRIAAIEGPGWMAWERRRESPIPTSFYGVLDAHRRAPRPEAGEPPTTYGNILHGSGGWNRYFIKTDGSVWLSARHMTQYLTDADRLKAMYLAESLGIGIFW